MLARGERLPTARQHALGSWSHGAPPYLSALTEREFARLKEQWLYWNMRDISLAPSCRVLAYFMTDLLNWATMDCWAAHVTWAGFIGTSEKTVQRCITQLEEAKRLSVWRFSQNRAPLRYAPVYARPEEMRNVQAGGHSWSEPVDTGVHESSFQILPESSLEAVRDKEKGSSGLRSSLSRHPFRRHQRGQMELDVANLVGGLEMLNRLAIVHDDIVTRICMAHDAEPLSPRQIKAVRLAAKQSRMG